MKKNLIKKVFAVSLSIAMACSLLPAANPVTASAAAPYVSLKTTFKTLKVGQKYKMTLKNNTVSWKIKKVETTAKTIATVYGKTTSSVMIKGKSEGRATIRVYLKTAKRKTKNTKTLRCRVKVVTDTTVNPTPTQTDATVTNQAELDAALKETNITKITIKPATAENFVIASGTYANVDLIVDAPQSDITNSATFKSVTVNNIKPETWTEKGSGNTFTWNAANGRFVVDKGANVKTVNIAKAGKVAIQVNEGTLGAVNVTAKADVSIEGKLAEGAAAIAISFSSTATDATLKTAVKVAVTTLAKIATIFEKGAEDSTVKLAAAGISVKVTNNTTKAIVVTKNNNETASISAGKTSDVSAVSTNTPGGSTGTYPGSSTSKPLPKAQINTGSSITVSVSGTVSGEAVTGEVSTVTGGVITVNVEHGDNVITPSGYSAEVEYSVKLSAKGWSKTVNSNYRNVDIDLKGAPIGKEITVTVSCRIKETASYAASAWKQVRPVKLKLSVGNVSADPANAWE